MFLRHVAILIIPLFLILTPTLVFGHDNYTASKGCQALGDYWFDNVCKHGQPPRAVATTTFGWARLGQSALGGFGTADVDKNLGKGGSIAGIANCLCSLYY